jgi:hypothetical protein
MKNPNSLPDLPAKKSKKLKKMNIIIKTDKT